MGPATWKRAQRRSTNRSDDGLILTTQRDGAHALPKDIPELIQEAIQLARNWQPDAVPFSIDFKQIDAPNMKGPEVRISFVSPYQYIGMMLIITEKGAQTHEYKDLPEWNGISLPVIFVDLPAALNIARKSGMKGPLKKANLRIWNPNDAPPVLAWILQSSTASGKTVDAATGAIIEFDVTGYIDQYNNQWEQAAQGLRRIMEKSSPSNLTDAPASWSTDSENSANSGESVRVDYERNAAEGRAYWGGSAEDYNRIKNGECSWSDSSNFGC